VPDFTVRSVAETADLTDVLDATDPATFRILGDLEERGIGPEVQGWLAEDADGAPAAAVTVAELCRDRWYASVMLFDERAASATVDVIMRSPAWEISGGPEHVEPLLPHLTRRGSVTNWEWTVIADLAMAVPPEIEALVPPRDPRCRPATGDDLDDLVEVYSTFELDAIPTRPRLRAYLERCLEHRAILVAEVDGIVAGAYRAEFVSSRFAFWSALTVLPEYRRQHLGSGLSLDAMYITRYELERGMITTTVASNPMLLRPPSERGETWRTFSDEQGFRRGGWMKARLAPPQRFPGHRYVRRAREVAEGSVRRREKGPDIRPAPRATP
jgi:GNAT superfamily N-acetyltransferase